MKAGIIVLLLVEVLAAAAGLVLLAKRRKLSDILIYGGVTFALILVTGIVGEVLWSATFEQMSSYHQHHDPHFGHWAAALALIPLGTASVAGYALQIETLRIPKLLIGSTAILGASVGLPLSQFMPLFGGWEMNGEPWSDARLSLIPGHVMLFLVLGAAVGGFVVWRSATGTPSVSSSKGGDGTA
jgi:hypothetical protein